jgi:hypothetical protein
VVWRVIVLRRRRVEIRGRVEVWDRECDERKFLIASRSWVLRVYERNELCMLWVRFLGPQRLYFAMVRTSENFVITLVLQ